MASIDEIVSQRKAAITGKKDIHAVVAEKKASLLQQLGQAVVKPIQELATLSASPYMLLPEVVRNQMGAVVPTPEQLQRDLPGAAGTIASFIPGGAVAGMAEKAALGPIATMAAQGLAAGTAMGGTRALVAGEPVGNIAQEAGTSGLLGGALGAVGGKVAGKIKKMATRPVIEKELVPGSDEELVARLTEGIKKAVPVRERQAGLDVVERQKRLGSALAAMKETGGEGGHYAALRKLKGELPVEQWAGVKSLFNEDEVNRLFDMPAKSGKVEGYDIINAQTALMKLFGMEGKRAPAPGELELLREVYGPDLVQAALRHRSSLEKMGSLAVDLLNLPRAMMSGPDLSGAGRQAMPMIGHPAYWKALPNMVRAFGSEKVYQASLARIKAMPNFKLMKAAGLEITEAGTNIAKREEQFASQMAEKIPLWGKVIRASNRSFITMLNETRAGFFNSVYHIAEKEGAAADPLFLKSVAEIANILTGRGNLGKLNAASRVWNAVLFAPRLFWSRIQILNPATYVTMHPIVRREAIRTLLRTATIQGSVLALAKASGAKVETDPRSADFLKIRVGNTRVDLMGGVQQPIRLLVQELSGTQKSSITGRVTKLNDSHNPMAPDRIDILQRWIEGKTQPIASLILAIGRGKNFAGQPVNISSELVQRMTPMVLQDTYDALREWGPEGMAVLPIAGAGLGVQTYAGKKWQQSKKGAGFRQWEDALARQVSTGAREAYADTGKGKESY